MAGVNLAKQDRLVLLRLAGASVTEIAEDLGVAQQSVSAALAKPEVQEQLASARDKVIHGIAAALNGIAIAALRGLRAIAENEDNPVGVRRQAWSDLADRCGIVPAQKLDLTVEDNRDTKTPEERMDRVLEAVRLRLAEEPQGEQ